MNSNLIKVHQNTWITVGSQPYQKITDRLNALAVTNTLAYHRKLQIKLKNGRLHCSSVAEH